MVSKGVKGVIGLAVAVVSIVWLVSGTVHYMGDMKKYDQAEKCLQAKAEITDQVQLALDHGDQVKADELNAQHDAMQCSSHI